MSPTRARQRRRLAGITACLATFLTCAAILAVALEHRWPFADLGPVIVVGAAAYVGIYLIAEAHFDARQLGPERRAPRAADVDVTLDELRERLRRHVSE